jgi:hypothetical protein
MISGAIVRCGSVCFSEKSEISAFFRRTPFFIGDNQSSITHLYELGIERELALKLVEGKVPEWSSPGVRTIHELCRGAYCTCFNC